MQAVDEKLNVAAVYPDGTVSVYGHTEFHSARPFRPFLYSRTFLCWGHAKEWADEYEDRQRRELLARSH